MSEHPPVKDQVYWFTKRTVEAKPLTEVKSADAVIVGGGFMGLACALRLHRAGLKVVVLEKGVCGGGASGRSSGFITPDSELSLSVLTEKFGQEKAKQLWEFAISGVELIRRTIDEFALKCDFQIQDCLFVANRPLAYKQILSEHQARRQHGYVSKLFTQASLPEALGAAEYFGGLRYNDTFSLDGYAFCQELKLVLQQVGVEIYENSEVTEFGQDYALTAEGRVHAKHVIMCIDRWLPAKHLAKPAVSSAQTFLGLTEPLSDDEVAKIFPAGPCMVWDTELIYNYLRLTPERRLLVGSSSLVFTYMRPAKGHYDVILNKMYAYLAEKLPDISVNIEYFWPGSIGVSKDFLPVVGVTGGVVFGGAAAGLPWAMAIGNYLAEKVVSGRQDFDQDFNPARKFTVPNSLQAIVPKSLAFAISQGTIKLF